MKYGQIFTIIFLLSLSIALYFSITFKSNINREMEINRTIKPINIPKIVIPKKSIEFTINKDKYGLIQFHGIFSTTITPKKIAKLLDSDNLKYQIQIDSKREENNATIPFLKKLLNRFTDSYLNWSIVYRDRKLLISGKTTDIEDKNSIERILNLSQFNSFSHIEVINVENGVDIISKLKSTIEIEDDSFNDDIPSEDEVEDILLTLKSLAPKELNIKKEVIRKHIKKRVIKKVKKIPKRVKKVKPSSTQTPTTTKIPTPKPTPLEEDILSLPFVKPVTVEEVMSLKTKKPLVEQETIYIKSNEEELYKDLPWAKLEDIK